MQEIIDEKGPQYGRGLIEEDLQGCVVMANYGKQATYIVKSVDY